MNLEVNRHYYSRCTQIYRVIYDDAPGRHKFVVMRIEENDDHDFFTVNENGKSEYVYVDHHLVYPVFEPNELWKSESPIHSIQSIKYLQHGNWLWKHSDGRELAIKESDVLKKYKLFSVAESNLSLQEQELCTQCGISVTTDNVFKCQQCDHEHDMGDYVIVKSSELASRDARIKQLETAICKFVEANNDPTIGGAFINLQHVLLKK